MWSEIIRIFLTIVLSIAFLILFGGNNIKRYLERNIGKISDEEFMKQEDIPVPGDTFAIALERKTFGAQSLQNILVVISIVDTSNLVERKKVCHGIPDLEGCIEKDQSKILETDPSRHSFYVDHFRKVIKSFITLYEQAFIRFCVKFK